MRLLLVDSSKQATFWQKIEYLSRRWIQDFFVGGLLEKIGKILKKLEKMDKILKKLEKIFKELAKNGQNFVRWGGRAIHPWSYCVRENF